ncbi:uncharacterized protein isoform X3 [Rhodnius prolixus]
MRRKMEEALEKGELENVDDLIIKGRLSELSEISGFDSASTKMSKFSSPRGAQNSSGQEMKRRYGKKTKEEEETLGAIQMIQSHERARKVRLRIQLGKEHARLIEDIDNLKYTPIPEEKKAEVTLTIQRHWQRYRDRRKADFIKDRRRLILKLYVSSDFDRSYRNIMGQLEEIRRKHQIENLKAMQDISFIYKMRMERKKEVKQGDLELELMEYVWEWYETTRLLELPNIPDWPGENLTIPPFGFLGIPKKIPEELSKKLNLARFDVLNQLFGHDFVPLFGSELIAAGHWVPASVWVEIKKALEEFEDNKKKKGKKQKTKTKIKKAPVDPEWYLPHNSEFTDELLIKAREAWFDYCERGYEKQREIWETEAEINDEINRSVRLAADVNIRNNLEILRTALKKGKVKRQREKIQKERKEDKTESKDLTEGMETWQVYEIMVKNQMIQKYYPILMKELEGEYSFKNHELRRKFGDDPPPSLGDLYQVIKEFCIFPLADIRLRKNAPLIQSVLFIGPKCYTYPIVDAICTETGSVLFYLNPLEVADKFPLDMVEHLFTKVPKLFEPVVIHLDGAEKPYYKKEPPDEVSKQPKFLTRILPKIIGYIQRRSRVLVVGTSQKPWEASARGLMRIFAKIIPIPDMDHHFYEKIWRESIMRYRGVARGFDYPTLAMLSKGLKQVDIETTVYRLMTTDKILSLKYQPLKLEEFEILLTTVQEPRSYWTWAQNNLKTFKARKKMLKKEKKKEKETKEKKPNERTRLM